MSYDVGTFRCEAALTCMGVPLSTGDLVCGASPRLAWTAPGPRSPFSIVLERGARLVIQRNDRTGAEMEAEITSFRDFDLERP